MTRHGLNIFPRAKQTIGKSKRGPIRGNPTYQGWSDSRHIVCLKTPEWWWNKIRRNSQADKHHYILKTTLLKHPNYMILSTDSGKMMEDDGIVVNDETATCWIHVVDNFNIIVVIRRRDSSSSSFFKEFAIVCIT